MCVAAEVEARIDCMRTDHSYLAKLSGLQRQRAVVFQQNDGLRRRTSCGAAFSFLRKGFLQQFQITEGMLKQTHAEFLSQNPQNGPVQYGHVSLAGSEPLLQLLTVRKRRGKLDIHAGLKTVESCVGIIPADLLDIIDLGDSAVVRYSDAVKPHFLPEKPGQISG